MFDAVGRSVQGGKGWRGNQGHITAGLRGHINKCVLSEGSGNHVVFKQESANIRSVFMGHHWLQHEL